MQVFTLIIRAKPEENSLQALEFAGAFVNCFIVTESLDFAKQTAFRFLREKYWIPVKIEESYEVTEDDYKDDPDGLKVYKQVLIDKEMYTLHTYLKEED